MVELANKYRSDCLNEKTSTRPNKNLIEYTNSEEVVEIINEFERIIKEEERSNLCQTKIHSYGVVVEGRVSENKKPTETNIIVLTLVALQGSGKEDDIGKGG